MTAVLTQRLLAGLTPRAGSSTLRGGVAHDVMAPPSRPSDHTRAGNRRLLTRFWQPGPLEAIQISAQIDLNDLEYRHCSLRRSRPNQLTGT